MLVEEPRRTVYAGTWALASPPACSSRGPLNRPVSASQCPAAAPGFGPSILVASALPRALDATKLSSLSRIQDRPAPQPQAGKDLPSRPRSLR